MRRDGQRHRTRSQKITGRRRRKLISCSDILIKRVGIYRELIAADFVSGVYESAPPLGVRQRAGNSVVVVNHRAAARVNIIRGGSIAVTGQWNVAEKGIAQACRRIAAAR